MKHTSYLRNVILNYVHLVICFPSCENDTMINLLIGSLFEIITCTL